MNFSFPTKYVYPKKFLKFSHWPSKVGTYTSPTDGHGSSETGWRPPMVCRAVDQRRWTSQRDGHPPDREKKPILATYAFDALYVYMDVSENSGTPKSSILIWFSIINHPFSKYKEKNKYIPLW